MKLRKKKNIVIAAAILFLALAVFVYYHVSFIIGFDRVISDFSTNLHTVSLDQIMVFITKLGNISKAIIIFILLAIIFVIKRKKYALYTFTLATVLSPIIAGIVKVMVGRTRPPLSSQIIIKETDSSFPSGHATIATVFLLSTVILIAPVIKDKLLRKIFLTLSMILFPLIALSRIYLSVHYASDVIGGILLGIICYVLSDLFVTKYLKR